MKKWIMSASGLLAIIAVAQVSPAGDLGEATEILCSPSWAISCADNHVCETGLPAEWNIPELVVADLAKKTLGAPGADGESRITPIETAHAENGLIFIQGHELGRAFSFVVSESTGKLSGSITTENLTIAVFGVCSTLPIQGVAQ
jgi:hypothetical protein